MGIERDGKASNWLPLPRCCCYCYYRCENDYIHGFIHIYADRYICIPLPVPTKL